jgi:glutamine synthetase
MAHQSGQIDGGMSHRDADAQLYKESRHVIFTGNGYATEWPVEAEKRGLPNLNTTPKAIATWASDKNKKLFEDLKIFTPEETEARAEVMVEAYNTALTVEASTMVQMMESAIIPACVKDLAKYRDFPKMSGGRAELYESIVTETDKLKGMLAKGAEDGSAEAKHLCDEVKPQMVELRKLVDQAEGLLENGLYPYPTYEELLYSHHH